MARGARETRRRTPRSDGTAVADRMAESAVLLAARRVLLTAASALAAAVVARLLGPARYGPFVSALTLYTFASAIVDFGFSLYLSREMARQEQLRPRLLAATIQVQVAWSAVTTLAMVVLAVAIGGSRGTVLLVIAPAVLVSGLGAFRQIFYVTYRIGELTRIDVPVNLAQSAAMVAVAVLGLGVAAVAATFTLGTIVNTLWVAARGVRLIPPARADRQMRRDLIGSSAGMGMSSLMATVYFGLDVVVLGWLVGPAALGQYGAGVKILSLLVSVPGLVMSAVLPGLSVEADEPSAFGALAARVWHWLLVAGLPAVVGVAVFAGPVVSVVFGPAYRGAVVPLRVLSLAAGLALASNLTGILMMSRRLVRPQLTQNTVAIVLNFAGNLALVPRYGIVAAAWLTVLSEAVVVGGGLISLRGTIDLRGVLGVTVRPAGVLLGAAAVAEALLVISTPLAVVAYLVAVGAGLVGLHAWPAELRRPSLLWRTPFAGGHVS
jgi:O-antigen/teichoic acid export membrane protein